MIWNSNWGSNACFESHATQPRATLFDNCSGGLVRYHAGGAEDEAPNHLSDLTIWNLNVTGTIVNRSETFLLISLGGIIQISGGRFIRLS